MRRSFPDGVTAHQRRYVQRGVVKAKVDLKCVVVVRQRSVYSSIDGLFRRIRLVGRAHRSSSKQAERGIRSLMITIKKYGSIFDTTVKNNLLLMDTYGDYGLFCFSVLKQARLRLSRLKV